MKNIETFTISDGREFVLIHHDYDDGFTTMPKAYYDAQLEEQANDQSL